MKKSYAKQLDDWRKRRERARRLKECGYTLAQIGDILGCTKQRVHQLLLSRS